MTDKLSKNITSLLTRLTVRMMIIIIIIGFIVYVCMKNANALLMRPLVFHSIIKDHHHKHIMSIYETIH